MANGTRRHFLSAGTAALASGFSLPNLSAAIQNTTSLYRRPKLKITDVRTAMVMVHGPQAHVRIYTDQGLIGQGESTDAAVGTPALIRSFRPFLIGKDPLNIDAIWDELRRAGIFSGAQGGQYTTALSGLEIALWDLVGKALGLPIYQLMGGKFRDRVRMYCDSDMRDVMGAEGERTVAWVQEAGFTATKMDIDDARDPARFDRVNRTASNGEIDRMVREVRHIREILPKSIDLAVDMHGFYDAPTGKRVAQEMEGFHLLWLEEPVPAENIDAMAEIRRSTKTPICCGENLFMRWGFTSLLEKRAVDIIMPDIQKAGGLSEARKIANLAEAYYIPFAPHCVVSPLGTMASAHVCASVPNFLVCEWHWINYPELWKNWVKEGEIIEKGHIAVPDRPGIGVEMNDEVARSAQIPGTPWFASGEGA
jgi:galactonate dehydratase